MTCLGIDPSLRATGLYSTRSESGTVIDGSQRQDPGRLDLIYQRVRSVIQIERPRLIVLEGFAYGATHDREKAGKARAVVELAIHHEGLWPRTRIVPPTTLKKFALGKGTGEKGEMMAAAREQFGRTFTDHNVCDAFWLAVFGLRLARFPDNWESLSRAQFEAVKGVHENPQGEQNR